jgi:methionyl-tRNA formyltransferase
VRSVAPGGTLRTAYLASPPFGTLVLEWLVESRQRPGLVVTTPDRREGRGRTLAPSPLAALAERASIPVVRAESVREEACLDALRSYAPDVVLVASWGELLRADFLALPRLAVLNVHPSLLPRHRGATPVQAAILAGDETTGVSIQRVVLELDAGDVLVQRATPLGPDETAGELAERRTSAATPPSSPSRRSRPDARSSGRRIRPRRRCAASSRRRAAGSTGRAPRPSSRATCAR